MSKERDDEDDKDKQHLSDGGPYLADRMSTVTEDSKAVQGSK